MNKREFYEGYVSGRTVAEKKIKKFNFENALEKVALGTKKIIKKTEPIYKKGEKVGDYETITEMDVLPHVKALEMGLNKYALGEYDKKPLVETKPIPKQIEWENLTEEEIDNLADGKFEGNDRTK